MHWPCASCGAAVLSWARESLAAAGLLLRCSAAGASWVVAPGLRSEAVAAGGVVQCSPAKAGWCSSTDAMKPTRTRMRQHTAPDALLRGRPQRARAGSSTAWLSCIMLVVPLLRRHSGVDGVLWRAKQLLGTVLSLKGQQAMHTAMLVICFHSQGVVGQSSGTGYWVMR